MKRVTAMFLVLLKLTGLNLTAVEDKQPTPSPQPSTSLSQEGTLQPLQISLGKNETTLAPTPSKGYQPPFDSPKFSFQPQTEELPQLLFDLIIPEPSESQIKLLLNRLQITSANPTTEELYEKLALFTNKQDNITPESNDDVSSIIKQIKENTNSHLADNSNEDDIKSYIPSLPHKDYKKLDYIYNIQKQTEKILKAQLESYLSSSTAQKKDNIVNKLSKLSFVAKYSKTDEDINKLGYYDPQKNLLVIFPDNIQEKCQKENLDFKDAITTFFQNFVALLKYSVTSTNPLTEQTQISCTELMTFQPDHHEQSDIARLLLCTKEGTTYTELEQAILEQNITEIYQMFDAKTASDFCKINQIIASIANRNGESSIFKDLIIIQTNDKYQDLSYAFQAGIERIIAISQANPSITLEQTLATYNALQNVIAQTLCSATPEELNQIAPILIKLNDSFLCNLSLQYMITVDEIIAIQNSGHLLLIFLNLTTPNPEQLLPQEKEEINEIYSYYHSILQILPYAEYLTAFEWNFTLPDIDDNQTTPTIQYSYTFNPEQKPISPPEEATPTSTKYTLSLKRNTSS